MRKPARQVRVEAVEVKVADLDGRSSSDVVADLAPGARVKAFNTLRPGVLGAGPGIPAGRRVIFLSGA